MRSQRAHISEVAVIVKGGFHQSLPAPCQRLEEGLGDITALTLVHLARKGPVCAEDHRQNRTLFLFYPAYRGG